MSKQMDDGGSPQESLELRRARRLIAKEDECLVIGHALRVDHDGDAVCQNGCGTVFHVRYSHVKELR